MWGTGAGGIGAGEDEPESRGWGAAGGGVGAGGALRACEMVNVLREERDLV